MKNNTKVIEIKNYNSEDRGQILTLYHIYKKRNTALKIKVLDRLLSKLAEKIKYYNPKKKALEKLLEQLNEKTK